MVDDGALEVYPKKEDLPKKGSLGIMRALFSFLTTTMISNKDEWGVMKRHQ